METITIDTSLCEQDFCTRAERQTELIRQGRFEALDFENIAEEIADTGETLLAGAYADARAT